MSDKYPSLKPVSGRRVNRSIDDMERAARTLLEETQDQATVALLCDYVRMGREYGDRMQCQPIDWKERAQKAEAKLKAYVQAEKCLEGMGIVLWQKEADPNAFDGFGFGNFKPLVAAQRELAELKKPNWVNLPDSPGKWLSIKNGTPVIIDVLQVSNVLCTRDKNGWHDHVKVGQYRRLIPGLDIP